MHFEKAVSKRSFTAKWVPFKNNHDGKGYRRVAAHPRGPEIFCAWVLMVQIASKMPVRGVLADESGELDADDMSVATGMPVAIFSLALEVLSSPKIGWIETDGKAFVNASQACISIHEQPTIQDITLHNIIEYKTDPSESILDQPAERVEIDPIDTWKMERFEPWAKKLKPWCSTLGPKTWMLYKALVDKYGIEKVSKVAWNNLGTWKWPDDLAAILATCVENKPETEDPDTSRAIVVLKAKGWQQAVDYVGLGGVSSEQDAIAACRANPGLVAELLEWVGKDAN